MPNLKRQVLILAGAVLMAITCQLSPCTADGADQSLTYRLKWLLNMSTAGELVAEQQGYFNAEGLSVTIKPGGPERDAIRELELGYADFGVASADQVIRALTKGSPVVVVAQLFQVNPLQWIYRPDRMSISDPKDLKGKAIGVTFGKNDEIILRALLDLAGFEERQVRLYGVRLDYAPFYRGLVDLWPVYINTQGVEIGGRLRAAGETVGFFNPAEFGVRFVANSVVTSQNMRENHPEIVKRFLRALLKGWRKAMDPVYSDQTIQVVQRFDRDTTRDVLRRQLEATRELVVPKSDGSIGAIDRQGWRQTEQIMLDHHQIPGPVHVLTHLRPIPDL